MMLLTIKQVMEKVSFSKDYIYKHMKKNEFPKQVKIQGSSRWKASEIDAWINAL